ncbi:uncharacterized protein KGF55_003811 [Candida pseudojiufengensis]|uniref:uncharacterized protein n=1 Tax=Candida pseudojiufengensis TaxID=497109 RepID=UPI00222477C5|nr:uncharacterized protein KGF55_003811 [Candida pseudojiufengensis]KAI5961840.1 hypothetical protein KGF55_003811 [Candida pseudojiufengensis]
MSEERQKLLQQKRQRLLELRQKRASNANANVDAAHHVKQSIDVSIQTDPIEVNNIQKSEVRIESETKQLITYEAGVQTTSAIEDVPKEKSEPIKPNFINKSEISPNELNTSIIDSIKLINKLQITKTVNLKKKEEEVKVNLNFVESSEHFKFDRPITSVDRKDSSLVVSFEKSSKFDHDAIIYHIEEGSLIPTNYLTCIPAITNIQFDKFNRQKTLGFSNHDKFCIWELDSSALIQNPTIMTNSSFLLKRKDWLSHNDTIVLTKQIKIDTNECLLTLSKNLILNIWSMNLLSSPKYSFDLNDKKEVKLQRIMDAIYIGDEELVGEVKSDVFKILLIGVDNKIYDEALSRIHEDSSLLLTTSIASLSRDYIITAQLDWRLIIWKKDQFLPYKIINYSKKILKVIARPDNDFQFLTLSEYQNKQYIEFWDFTIQLYKPLLKIVEQNKSIDILQFNGPNELCVGDEKEITNYKLNKDYKFVNDVNTFDKGLSI